ncbi:MAG: S24 family peptidase [Candidatus Azobacteroides sp.]|nr:S24 family peptidase [Candidatus Azobacteroides sp.]
MNGWSRLEKVIGWAGLSVNAFAKSIGLKRAENLYQIKKGNNSISKDLSELIAMKYCSISKSWLLTGEGNMFTEDAEKTERELLSTIKRIPFYNYDISMLKTENGKFPPTERYIEVPLLDNCDFATLCVGESMTPDIPSGSILTLKEISIDRLLPGEIYYIVTDEFCTVKFLRTVENDRSKLRLVPGNKDDYDEMILDKNAIRHLFLVKGVISYKIL